MDSVRHDFPFLDLLYVFLQAMTSFAHIVWTTCMSMRSFALAYDGIFGSSASG